MPEVNHAGPATSGATAVSRRDHSDDSPPSVVTGEFVDEKTLPQSTEPVLVKSRFEVDKWREITRGGLAALLFALLTTVVIIVLVASLSHVKQMSDLTDMLGVLLAPLVGLVGAATGFYYGQGK